MYVGYALRGMQAGVAAVIADVVYTMAKSVIKNKKAIQIIIMLASFVAAYFFDISVMLVLILCATVGLVFGRGNKKV